MKRLAVAAVALLLTAATPTGWTFYGSSSLGREEPRSFYRDVTRLANGHLQISTEDLTLEGLNVAVQSDSNSAQGNTKLATGYRPPFASLRPLSGGALLEAVEFEEIANAGLLTPRTQFVRELDCAGKKIRTISIVEDSVAVDADKLDQTWQNILPGSPSFSLVQLVCR